MGKVILVDAWDRQIGIADKLEAHQSGGRLHRAFSIMLFGPDGRVLIQKRAAVKYHFGGLWTNACCGHPRPGEELVEAARLRLREELGRDAELRRVFSLSYAAMDLHSGLAERELDHVLVGTLAGEVAPDPKEIDELCWVDCEQLVQDVGDRPERYTPWFRLMLERLPELKAAAETWDSKAAVPRMLER